MTAPRDFSLVLVASSADFTTRLGKLLMASDLAWSALGDLQDLIHQKPKGLTFLLLDGGDAMCAQTLQWIRSLSGWKEMPVAVIDAPDALDLSAEADLLTLKFPRTAQELSHPLAEFAFQRKEAAEERIFVERRSSFRLHCNLNATVELPVVLIDISEGGAQLEVPAPIAVGTEIGFSIHESAANDLRNIRMQVLHVRPAPAENRFRVSGQFVNVTKDFQRDIRRLMLKLQIVISKQVLGSAARK
ncbi:MAG: PilZ domain-containing protein [Planctomycetota bacterium]|nr:PilZ domain-containing protein [Planctomycetota bacterium]